MSEEEEYLKIRIDQYRERVRFKRHNERIKRGYNYPSINEESLIARSKNARSISQ